MREIFSIDVWQGLQLVTGWRNGALAPFCTTLSWRLNGSACWSLTADLLEQAFPYFSLFLGQGTTHLVFAISSDKPIYLASVATALNGPAAVKKLRIQDIPSFGQQGVPYLGQYLHPQSWTHIEELSISNVPCTALVHLAALPCLVNLTIRELHDASPLDYSEEDNIRGRLATLASHTTHSFPMLQCLQLFSSSIKHLAAFLQILPPGNQLDTLKCIFIGNSDQDETANRNLITTIQHHCNSRTMQRLVIRDDTEPTEYEEDQDLNEDAYLSLWPLFSFTKLEWVHINLQLQVSFGPDELDSIIRSWPNLVKLKINVRLPSSRLPPIDHRHLLKLVYNCRHLRTLGLRFNATLVKGDETAPRDAILKEPAPLTKLWVCDSPILSPSKVAGFLARHCPKLTRRYLDFLTVEEVAEEAPEFTPIYARRWGAVFAALRYV